MLAASGHPNEAGRGWRADEPEPSDVAEWPLERIPIEGWRGRGHIHQRLLPHVADGVSGLRRDKNQVARLNRLLLIADSHQPATSDDHIDLLVRLVGVDLLLAAGFPLDPRHRQPRGAKLAFVQQEIGGLPAPFVERAASDFLDEHDPYAGRRVVWPTSIRCPSGSRMYARISTP